MRKLLILPALCFLIVSCGATPEFNAPGELTGTWYADNMYYKKALRGTSIEFNEDGSFIVDQGVTYRGKWSIVEKKPVITMFDIKQGYQFEGRMVKYPDGKYKLTFYWIKASGEKDKAWVLENLHKSL